MRSRFSSLLMSLLAYSAGAWAHPPTGFRWVNFKGEPDTVARVGRLLQGEEYSAIREIGMVGDSVLAFTTARESGSTTPAGDTWTVYSISTNTAKVRELLNGYDMHMAA